MAGQITARAVSIAVIVVAVLGAALLLAILADAVFHRGAPPRYRLNATARCLRTEGYHVSRDGRRYFTVEQKEYGKLDVYFAPNAAVARRHAAADNSYTEPRNRNVVIEWEGGPFPQFLDACLRGR